MTQKLTDQEKIDVVEKYKTGKYTQEKLANEYNVSPSSIRGILKRRNIPLRAMSEIKRKYPLNERYFQKIDTAEKAYFLGFLYADGSNCKKCVSVQLNDIDEHILRSFADALGSNMPIFRRTGTPYVGFSFASVAMVNDLNILGCVPQKSLILKFPTEEQVPLCFMSHFIRGYFDGDGCIYYNPNTKYGLSTSFSFVSTLEFCKGARDAIESALGITLFIKKSKHCNNSNTYVLHTGNQINICKIYNWLYLDTDLYLIRKYNNFTFISKELQKRILSRSQHDSKKRIV